MGNILASHYIHHQHQHHRHHGGSRGVETKVSGPSVGQTGL